MPIPKVPLRSPSPRWIQPALNAAGRQLGAFGVALLGALAPSVAHAHGAFPQSAFVYEDPSDDQRIWVGASFGLLTSTDRGASWYWLCENAPGYEGVKPKMDVSANGSLLVGSFDGVNVSADGCAWSAPAGPAGRFVSFVHTERSDPNSVLALVSLGQPGNLFLNQVWASPDNGQSFVQLGDDLDTGLLSFSVMSAPSDSQRLYVTGNVRVEAGPAEGKLLVSRDRGQNWEYLAIPGADSTHPPHLLGVHPTDPDQLFVRINGEGLDTLLISRDAGQSFSELMSKQAELFGFAFDPDGNTLRVGFGDARDKTLTVDENDLGIYSAPVATLGSASFVRDLEGPIGCLGWVHGQLYACTSQFFHGYELGRSNDGVQFEGVMTLSGVEDALSCPADTVAGEICPPKWPETCTLIGKCVPGQPDGGGGSGGSAGGSAGGSSGDDAEGGGCGCSLPGDRPAPGGALMFGVAALGCSLARRKRRLRKR